METKVSKRLQALLDNVVLFNEPFLEGRSENFKNAVGFTCKSIILSMDLDFENNYSDRNQEATISRTAFAIVNGLSAKGVELLQA